MLYVRLFKALYGLLQSALLFYKKLRGELEDYGFEVNPYNPCVANKIVNGSQMTVTWHIDDLKVSHRTTMRSQSYYCFWGSCTGIASRLTGELCMTTLEWISISARLVSCTCL